MARKTDKRDRPESSDELEDLSPHELERYADRLIDDPRLSSVRARSGLPGPVSSTPMGNGMK